MTLREAEHLLGDPIPQIDQSTTTNQDELRSTRQRPFNILETASGSQSSRPDMNNECTVTAGDVSSEVFSPPPSQACVSLGKKEPGLPCSIRRTTLPPWTLRRVSLLTFIGCLLSFVVILEVLCYMSNKHQGLATSGEKAYYLWKYCPTASKFKFYGRRWKI
jgi:hypothetical protein